MSEFWIPIAEARRDVGVEIIGCHICEPADGVPAYLSKEPFISFWSPTLQRFYGSPTHWIPFPRIPR